MNTKEYIESGVLELYAFGQLSATERAEVERACAQYPDVNAELREIESAVTGYAASYSRKPDPSLRSKILNEINPAQKPEPRVIAMDTRPGNSYRWLAAASIALFIISAGANFYLYNKYQDATGQLADLQSKSSVLADNNKHLTKEIEAVSGDLTTVVSPSNVRIELAGLPLSPTAKALIFWDKERKSTYINTSGMPPLAEGKQYQLWAIVDGKPVDLGMMPLEKSQTALIKVKDVSAPQAFAITIEPKGGSVSPTMDQMIVLGKL